ncbi:hypothetical protein [Olleya sp. Bg11-27]|uniref:hypothetical protein n=1 Tax=Olleya sp. Bg11-27 TaxID=2058135 RepID=UPI000C309B8D|nr:hypothetical protein [Olleya sp. Bg11-27]AUC74311.1 hypothetical protein CW732_00910 [Olleya sp. Bg11-27]
MSKINQNWAFGNKAGLDFSTNPPTSVATAIGSVGSAKEGCASISDDNGNLLFYTDGMSVWDNTHTVKMTGLQGDFSSTQSAIIVPNPGSNNEYYVFTMDGSSNASGPFNHLNGVLIDLSSSTWSFTPLSNLMTLPSTTGFSPCEKITAVQHSNCKDFWLITVLQKGIVSTSEGSGVFRILKITASGVIHEYDLPMNQKIVEIGYLKGSPNGTKLALANGKKGNVLVYDFDPATGVIDIVGVVNIDIPITTSDNTTVYGVEFSPDNNLLYYANLVSGRREGRVFQVDLTSNSPVSIEVGAFKNKEERYAIGALQLGPDGKIYIVKDNENSLGAILKPNIVGLGCTVDIDYITLQKGTLGYLGLPNLISNPCPDDDCGCGCTGCNDEAESQNEELIERAKTKYNTIKSDQNCPDPFMEHCKLNAITNGVDFKPCFSFHWGDGINDQIEEHDTEVFYLTVCNTFKDIKYNGLRITKVTLTPDIHPLDKIHIVPDRFVNLDCLEPCSCQTREFAMINRANDTAGNYILEVEYCFDSISLESVKTNGKVEFPLEITED